MSLRAKAELLCFMYLSQLTSTLVVSGPVLHNLALEQDARARTLV